MIMDVSLPQNSRDIRGSSIRKELRQRKYLVTNEQIEDIKPFKTYRKPSNTQDRLQQIDASHSHSQKYSAQSLKLKRQYPTDPFDANHQEIGLKQTKYKYDIEPINRENQPPLEAIPEPHQKKSSDIITDSQPRIPIVRKNIKYLHDPFLVGTNGGRRQVQSIIFDSKVTKLQEAQVKQVRRFTITEDIVNDQNIKVFQEKVDQVNNEIEAGLTNLQKMIGQLKKKKIAQSQIQAQIKVKSRLEELEKQFAQRRAECRQKQKIIDKPYQSQSVQQQKEINKELIQILIENEQKLKHSLEKAASPSKSKDEGVADSQIQLLGGINSKSTSFPPEYISFINRLANQIEKDIQFTNKITELTKSNYIQTVKSMILQQIAKRKSQELSIDETFLQLQPSEIDPLDQGKPGWYKTLSTEALEKEALKIYKMYKDIENNFEIKLHRKFSLSVLKVLFEELAQFNFTKSALNDCDSVTVGHLLSYLNMRTNKSFRNRSFVKMLKRLGLRSNSFLTMNSFGKLIVQ